MANSFFRFKQFTVHQEHCAMKVCTDACLFGAWAAATIQKAGTPAAHILDIGAGTGLLSLLIAQKIPARVDAVELDKEAAGQAAENFVNSPWKDRLTVFQHDIRTLLLPGKYDWIISNPPFFENDLKSPDPKRNLALHSQELGLEELLSAIHQHLSDKGRFALLVPFYRKQFTQALATKQGYFLHQAIDVQQTPAHDHFRSMLLFGKDAITPYTMDMVIREGDHYSAPFSELLKDYYLNL